MLVYWSNICKKEREKVVGSVRRVGGEGDDFMNSAIEKLGDHHSKLSWASTENVREKVVILLMNTDQSNRNLSKMLDTTSHSTIAKILQVVFQLKKFVKTTVRLWQV